MSTDDDIFADLEPTGLLCSECHAPQLFAPNGGETCRNGHGGAPGVESDGQLRLPLSAPVLPAGEQPQVSTWSTWLRETHEALQLINSGLSDLPPTRDPVLRRVLRQLDWVDGEVEALIEREQAAAATTEP